MADEIRILTIERNRRGFNIEALFLHALSPPLETVDAVPIVVTPSSELPALVTDYALMTAEEMAFLDTGAWVFEVQGVFITKAEAQDIAGLALPKVRDAYSNSSFVSTLRVRHVHTGRKVDA